MSRIDSILKTRLKRKSQICRVFEIKIDKSHLSQKSFNYLKLLFTEAKWFYNYCLSQDNINKANTTLKSVPVKVTDKFEERKFNTLKSHMKQGIKKRIFTSLKSLSTRKEQGHRVGRLKFRSVVNSIPLPEYHKDFDISFSNNRMRLTGLKQKLRVSGLGQIPEDAEIANATLVKKSNDFYFHITTFTDKEQRCIPEQSIGIDFGCETQLSLSDGTKIKFQVPTSKRIKKLDRKIMRRSKTSNSKNKYKDKIKRQKAYAKLNNKKKDIRNKIVSAITNNFQYVCFQDESIHAWKSGRHGKKIQHSGIGGIISDLKHKSETPIVVSKFFPSTQLCPSCGHKHKCSLSERIYDCGCGYSEERDIHAAKNIETEGQKKIPMDYREFTPEENPTSTFFDTLSKIDGIKVSKLVH